MTRLSTTIGIALAAFLAAYAVLGAGEQDPKGSDFQLNTTIEGSQLAPEVSMSPTGRFVAVWRTFGSPFRARLGSAAGPQGEDLVLTSPTLECCPSSPVVALQPSGDFVVAWEGDEYSPFPSVHAQQFAADGSPLSEPALVSAGGNSADFPPEAIDVDAAGRFVVTWMSCGGDTFCDYGAGVVARRFSASASPRGRREIVAPGSTIFPPYYRPGNPDVGVFNDGSYVVVWDDYGVIYGRRGLAQGGFDGPRFEINAPSGTHSSVPSVAIDHRGPERALVTWESRPVSGGDTDVFGRLLDPFGEPLGPAFQINTFTRGRQYQSDAAADGDGGFVVAWASDTSDGDESESSIRVRFGVGGVIASPPDIQVNTHKPQRQRSVAVAATPHLTLVTWQSESSAGTDDDGLSVQGRLFGPLLFSDGFESGDSSAWGASSPPP